MDPNASIARRFPLISRFRPACLPLPQRVRALVELSATAQTKADQGLASAVYNQAALLASDLGLPYLARRWCHQHAVAYLNATPLPGMTAIRALEPVVNLARLQIRAGNTDDGRQRLLNLFDAVSNAAPVGFEGVRIPAKLTTSDTDRHEVRAWLWRVILADGTRTLTTAGRWTEALAHIEKHHGLGLRMLDGRQVAVLATLHGDPEHATRLVAETTPGESWENAVTTCLAVMCHRAAHRSVDDLLPDMVNSYLQREPATGTAVFDTRLGLTVLDLLDQSDSSAAHLVAEELHRRTTVATDGYAARECLANPRFTSLVSSGKANDAHDLVHACGLNDGGLPPALAAKLAHALRASSGVIRDSLASLRPAVQETPQSQAFLDEMGADRRAHSPGWLRGRTLARRRPTRP
ncbi:hypothetical protein [Streptomyces zhihengii]|uniref:hypothetical protein n=1 Tax=Streptomyces zhihengii TaxID=1818004 RepID=UPI001FD00FE3|nr:hypothetical protein [Streptomyces zhihengii]